VNLNAPRGSSQRLRLAFGSAKLRLVIQVLRKNYSSRMAGLKREAAAPRLIQSQAGQVEAFAVAGTASRDHCASPLRAWGHARRNRVRHTTGAGKWGARLATQSRLYRAYPTLCISCDLTEYIQRQIYFLGVFENPVESGSSSRVSLKNRTNVVGATFAAKNTGTNTRCSARDVVGPHTGGSQFEKPIPSTYGGDSRQTFERNNHPPKRLGPIGAAGFGTSHGTVSSDRPQGYSVNLGRLQALLLDLAERRGSEAPAVTLEDLCGKGPRRQKAFRPDFSKWISRREPFSFARRSAHPGAIRGRCS